MKSGIFSAYSKIDSWKSDHIKENINNILQLCTKILKYQKNQSRKQLDVVSSLECRFLGKNSHSPIKQEEAKVLEILK